jgi:hypothetical protein
VKTLAEAVEYARRYHDGRLTLWRSPAKWLIAFGFLDERMDQNIDDSLYAGATHEEAITAAISADEDDRRAKSASGMFVGPCPHCRKPVLSESHWLGVPPVERPF